MHAYILSKLTEEFLFGKSFFPPKFIWMNVKASKTSSGQLCGS